MIFFVVVNKLNDAPDEISKIEYFFRNDPPKYYTHAELRNLEIFELRLLTKKQKSEILNIIFAYS